MNFILRKRLFCFSDQIVNEQSMLITNHAELALCTEFCRKWQGIPAIERSAKRRLFSSFYSDGTDGYVYLTYDHGPKFSCLYSIKKI